MCDGDCHCENLEGRRVVPRKKIYQHCPYDGDCDNCDLPDCYADPAEILDFYSRENEEARRRFGRQKLDKIIPIDKIGRRERRNGTEDDD